MKIFLNINFIKVTTFLICLLIFLLIFFQNLNFYKNKRIAHQGGYFKNFNNSIINIKQNQKKTKLFELDLQLTKDNRIICYHDEPKLSNHLFNSNYIKNLLKKKYCYDEEIKSLLKENPDILIITDFKTNNIEGLNVLSKIFEEHKNQFIVQIYFEDEYLSVKNMGFEKIIFTMYKLPNHTNQEIHNMIKKMELFAITMDPARLRKGMAKYKNNNFIYVHTVNSLLRFIQYKIFFGADEIYTDSLF